MRALGLLAIALLASFAARPAAARQEAPQTAREILDRVDDLYRGRSSHGKMTMRVATEHWIREMELEFWSLGKERSLIRILAPAKEKGTATLRTGNDMWNYLPKVNRVIKVPSSMMGGSWMGSHFTNDDLVKESRMADDFDFETTYEGERDGIEGIEITCIPKPDAAVVWGKVVVWVSREAWMPLSVRYHDEEGRLARTMTFDEVRRFGGRELPASVLMVPADRPAESTKIVYERIDFDLPIEEDFFSLRSLER